MYDKLIVLDLDETLLHSTAEKLAVPLSFNVGSFNAYLRPGCSEFIEYCFDNFKDVAVWTSSSEDYAGSVVESVFGEKASKLKFVWSRRRCTLRYDAFTGKQIWIKDLSKIRKRGYHNVYNPIGFSMYASTTKIVKEAGDQYWKVNRSTFEGEEEYYVESVGTFECILADLQ